MPINCSGGVLSSNPIGASGLLRFAEAALQVRGAAGDLLVAGRLLGDHGRGEAHGGSRRHRHLAYGAPVERLEHQRFDRPAEVDLLLAILAELRARGGAYAQALAEGRPVRVALNQVMARGDAALSEGAEVGLFPPVTGG